MTPTCAAVHSIEFGIGAALPSGSSIVPLIVPLAGS
jgi:hypothetical protein